MFDIVSQNASLIESVIDYRRDLNYSYLGFKTLCRSYLMRINGHIVERPQHMLMRVSIGIHKNDLQSAFETYRLMSDFYMTHATPTLFNSGTPKPQMASCFLLTMTEDSIDGIYTTLTRAAKISKAAGGIGINVSTIRASGSYIAGTNGFSNGLVPMLRVYNATARYVDQGGGKRKGAFAIYLEPWHADVFDFLDLRNNNGPDEIRARDLFYGLWINGIFMERVREDGVWSLMCPDECPGLVDCYGKKFDELYTKYEREGRFKKQVRAMELWMKILVFSFEHGLPYILFKDSANEKSNQKNLGCIRGSNLCTEIIEFTSPDEVAVCNLASVSLKKFIRYRDGKPYFDHRALFDVVYTMTINLNKVIDGSYYPIPEAERSNKRHRPIGLGVQGLAETFFEMRYPFESDEARQLNTDIFETIYFAACSASNKLAMKEGYYETFPGSPSSEGILQFDMWNAVPSSGRWDWNGLKVSIKQWGLRNSLLVAPMPTQSTSMFFENTECFEPISSNVFSRSTLAGNFTCVNSYLIADLIKLGLWNDEMKERIVKNEGSIQNIADIPDDIKRLYKTVYEISQRRIIQMAADRGIYIDQSQSMNLHFKSDVTLDQIGSAFFDAYEMGLKSGVYYCRTQAKVTAKKEREEPKKKQDESFGDMTYHFPEKDEKEEEDQTADEQTPPEEVFVCSREARAAGCLACGS